MGCFTPDAPAPRNYGQETRDTLQAQLDLAPQLYASEAQYQPQYSELALRNMNTLLGGNATTPGLTSLLSQAGTAQRSADIRDVATLGPQARQAILASDPDTAKLLELLNQQAVTGLESGSNLTPDELRQVTQNSRAAMAARGLSGSNAGLGNELLSQYNLGQQMMRQRQQFAGNVLGYNKATVGDPFMQILGRPSNAATQAQGMSPGNIFNPESSYSGNIYNSNQQLAAMFADPSTMAKIGQVSEAGGKFIGGVASAFV